MQRCSARAQLSSAQRAALLRSSTRLCSSRRNAPPLATGPLLLRPGLEADLTTPTIFRSDTAAEAPRARASTASSRSRLGFERFRMVFGRSWTHLSRRVAVVHPFPCSCCERLRARPQIVDPTQDFCDQRPHCHIGQLAHHAAAVAHDFLAPLSTSSCSIGRVHARAPQAHADGRFWLRLFKKAGRDGSRLSTGVSCEACGLGVRELLAEAARAPPLPSRRRG